MPEEILRHYLEQAKGFDELVVIAVTVIAIICWQIVGARNKEEKDRLKRQIRASAEFVLVGIILIAIHHAIPKKQFQPGVLGVLVLHIDGDNDGSLQRELVSNLNDELATGTNSPSIEVWAFDYSVEEKQGLNEAHDEARNIGKKTKALFVVWGSKVGETGLSPRITVVNALVPAGNRTLMEQDVHELINKDPTLTTFFGTGTKLKTPHGDDKPGTMGTAPNQ